MTSIVFGWPDKRDHHMTSQPKTIQPQSDDSRDVILTLSWQKFDVSMTNIVTLSWQKFCGQRIFEDILTSLWRQHYVVCDVVVTYHWQRSWLNREDEKLLGSRLKKLLGSILEYLLCSILGKLLGSNLGQTKHIFLKQKQNKTKSYFNDN